GHVEQRCCHGCRNRQNHDTPGKQIEDPVGSYPRMKLAQVSESKGCDYAKDERDQEDVDTKRDSVPPAKDGSVDQSEGCAGMHKNARNRAILPGNVECITRLSQSGIPDQDDLTANVSIADCVNAGRVYG